MLDLQSRIHLEEIEPARRIKNKFDGSCAAVFDGTRSGQCRHSHLLAECRSDCRRWRFFNNLLMPALDRTFPLEAVNEVAVRVAKNLKFDVPRVANVFLDEYPAVAERRPSFPGSRRHGSR